MATSMLAAAILAFVVVSCVGYTCIGPGGQVVREGAAWVAEDGCNVCTCYPSEVHCKTWKQCNDDNMLGAPGDPICSYALTGEYIVGQTWTTEDGCNQCVCTSLGMNCTYQPCPDKGFASPKPEGSQQEFGDCPYKTRLYRYGDHFLAEDGCNTCMCVLPGNFATFPACTYTPCDLLG